MLDGKPICVNGIRRAFGFSPDSKCFFAGIHGDEPTLYVDGNLYDGICNEIEFSPDSEHCFTSLYSREAPRKLSEQPLIPQPVWHGVTPEHHIYLDGKQRLRVGHMINY